MNCIFARLDMLKNSWNFSQVTQKIKSSFYVLRVFYFWLRLFDFTWLVTLELNDVLFDMFQASDGPFVVNHMENHPTFPTNTPHAEAFFSSSPGNVLTKRAGCWEDKDSFLDVSIY